MAYVKLFFTTLHSGGQVEPEGNGVGNPVEFTLRADLDEVGSWIGLTVKADDGYVIDTVVVTPTGDTAAKWQLCPDDGYGAPDEGSAEDYGDPLTLGDGVNDTEGIDFWVRAKATNDETPVNDVSVTLVVSGVASAE